MKLIALTSLALALSLAGCANPMKAQIMGANIEIAQKRAEAAAKPILDASIPTPNGVMHIVVHAPQGAGNSGQIAMPDDPWARAADRLVGVAGTLGGLYFGGQAAVGLVSATSGGIARALQSMPDPVVVQPATPVIVPAAEPVIVDPVVVNPFIVPPAEPVIVEPVIVNPVVVQVQAP